MVELQPESRLGAMMMGKDERRGIRSRTWWQIEHRQGS